VHHTRVQQELHMHPVVVGRGNVRADHRIRLARGDIVAGEVDLLGRRGRAVRRNLVAGEGESRASGPVVGRESAHHIVGRAVLVLDHTHAAVAVGCNRNRLGEHHRVPADWEWACARRQERRSNRCWTLRRVYIGNI